MIRDRDESDMLLALLPYDGTSYGLKIAPPNWSSSAEKVISKKAKERFVPIVCVYIPLCVTHANMIQTHHFELRKGPYADCRIKLLWRS